MRILIIPENVKISVEVAASPALIALGNRIVDLLEAPAKVAALTARLRASNARLAAAVAAHPDPDRDD